jgi:hypothetical protein
MNKREALEYLDLPGDASPEEIEKRIKEKLDYFRNLSENATSDFLRRLNRQNLLKVQAIKEDSLNWSRPYINEINIQQDQISQSEQVIESVFESQEVLTTPVIITVGKTNSENLKRNEPLAWMIRHVENMSSKVFPLFPGKYLIGRKNEPHSDNYIEVDGDPYVSRIHAVIEVNEDTTISIEDTAESNSGKPSKNGTYVNGNAERINGKLILKANDTVQIGITKMVLKINANIRIEEVVDDVKKSKFMHTVIIKNM